MKTKVFAISVLLLCVTARTAYSQNRYYLPHVANGSYKDGSFRTTFVLFNNTNSSAIVILQLSNDNGGPFTVNIPGLGEDSEFTMTLDAGESRVLQTDGSGNLASGAATVTSTANIGVSSIFTIYDTLDNFVTESGVGNSPLLSEFILPVDVTGAFDTGLAFFSPGGGASLTLILRGTDGGEVARRTTDVRTHIAQFVSELFRGVSNFQGTLLVQSDSPVAALTLRQNSTPLSYTSLPVVPRASTQTSMSLAQVANGSYAEGSFRTSFLLFNVSSAPANVSLVLTTDDGTSFPVTIGGQSNSTFNRQLAPNGSVFLQTDGKGPLAVGAARITSNTPIGAAAIFTVLDTQEDFRTESGVGDSPVLNDFTLPVDIADSFDTGIAFFNPGNSPVALTPRLLDSSGFLVESADPIQLVARGHTALFVSQLFAVSNFQGSLAISAPGGVAALTLRQNSSPLSYTTLPVSSGSAQGKTQRVPLLSQTESGVAATANRRLDKILPGGFRLSGRITGAGVPELIVAQAGTTSFYPGSIDFLSGRYLIVVPAGTYSLKVAYAPGLQTPHTTLVFTDPSAVQVSGDTTRDIALPSPTLFRVSGTVSGLSNLPATQSTPAIVFTSAAGVAQGFFEIAANGTYEGTLPASSYTASIDVANIQPSPLQTQNLSLFNIGTANVAGDTTANYSVPATARLSGRVQLSGQPILPGGTVGALDTSGPTLTGFALVSPPTDSTATADIVTGQYQMVLMRNRTHDVHVSIPFLQGTTLIGLLGFPVPANTVSMAGDTTLDFNVPAPPGQVTIAGKVTDSSGRGVAEVGVSAFTTALTGVPTLSFSGFAQTDVNGNYQLIVLNGTNYQVTFVPPLPNP
jgi:hypothetical protein